MYYGIPFTLPYEQVKLDNSSFKYKHNHRRQKGGYQGDESPPFGNPLV